MYKQGTPVKIIRNTVDDKMRIRILDFVRTTNEKGLEV